MTHDFMIPPENKSVLGTYLPALFAVSIPGNHPRWGIPHRWCSLRRSRSAR
jgi:hypothetical protein